MADLDYTELIPEDTTPEAIEDNIYDRIQTRWPDWEPSEGQLEVWIIKAISLAISQLYEVTTDVAAEIFAYFGETIVNIPRKEAFHATADSTWTVTPGTHTIPANTLVAIPDGLDTITFETAEEVTGESPITVPLRAVDGGTGANNLDGNPILIDTLAFVSGITLVAPTAGGVDEETMDEYLPRLVETLQMMSPRPILPHHFEILARQYGAYRAVAVVGLDPVANTTDNPLTVAVAVMDNQGAPLDAGSSIAFATKNYIKAQLEEQLMVNSIVHVFDPAYTAIDVTSEVVSLPEYDHAEVIAAVEATLTDYFTPINWGRREGMGQVPTRWVNTTTVRFLEIAEQINRVPGVDYIETLTFRKAGDSHGTSDVTISGHVPLTEPGTFTIT